MEGAEEKRRILEHSIPFCGEDHLVWGARSEVENWLYITGSSRTMSITTVVILTRSFSDSYPLILRTER